MSIEQLLLLSIFIIIPLLQSLFARLSKRRFGEVDPENESGLDALEVGRAEKRQPPYEPPPPFKPPPRSPRTAPAVIARPAPAPAAEPVGTTPQAVPALPPRAAKREAQNRYLRELLPRDARGLRRAVLLAEVLGPPRSLDRSDRSTR